MKTKPTVSSFAEKVIAVVRTIPKGKVMTYGAVAKKAGFLGAGRAVGSVMAKNTDKTMPCHRVVNANGKIGSYNGLRGDKTALLKKEGVKMSESGIINPRLLM